MSRITRFAARDPGPAARVAGFMAHLREHGLRVGVHETETALRALGQVRAIDAYEARLALKAVCSGTAEDVARFDDLFDSYWRNEGRVRRKVMPEKAPNEHRRARASWGAETEAASGEGTADRPDDAPDSGESAAEGTGRLLATRVTNLMKKDLREIVDPQEVRRAEIVARRLADAIRDHRSRRRRAARQGEAIDFRRVVRKSLSSGGEPLHLPRRRRPDRPVRLTVLCDVSGSMTIYAPVFLAFLAGLVRGDETADAYLFHTKLVRITDALRDDDPLRALNRLTLLADGFGGGSRIGTDIDRFARTYGRRFVTGRSVVVIMSDGYDTDPPEVISEALRRLKRRGCRIVWLNPLLGWQGYEPVARGMAAALPSLDLFAPANTLAALAGLEAEFARL
ncbi:vWA domain-containing protein [Lutibaculum baratangense]|uniref:Carbon monoxide oxidation accessory protein CoxE n=1 Tax=Lutibaculum baratangense AMV1 TaxID=631454 RepID=V4TI72_9HYPH|nr:VWA domain-containing protein [Lutibaculum baratangense]ESR25703.1 Carbon monoxide oxidation accessory protein CoxE [Lutibaculum baratangense AMV1]